MSEAIRKEHMALHDAAVQAIDAPRFHYPQEV